MANSFSGYLALGNGSGSFTEIAFPGYERRPVSFSAISSGVTSNNSQVAFRPFHISYPWPTSVTQLALYDEGGNFIAWWNLALSVSQGSDGVTSFPQGSIVLNVTTSTGSLLYASGSPIGFVPGGNSIFAANAIQVASGAISYHGCESVAGVGIGNVLGPLINYQGSGIPGLLTSSRLIIARGVTAPSDFGDIEFNRTTTYTGGSQAVNINAVMRVTSLIGANDAAQNWNFIAKASTAGAAGGITLGAFFQGNKLAGATDQVIAAITDANDQTNSPSSVSGALVTHEFDLFANKADDAANAQTFGGIGARKALHIVFGRQNAADSTVTEFSNGIWFGQALATGAADTLSYVDSAIGFAVNTQINSALDTRGAIVPTGSGNPLAAVNMAAGHAIDFKGGAALNSALGRYLTYNSGGTKFQYMNAGTEFFSVSDAGIFLFSGPSGILWEIDDPAATLVNGAHPKLTYSNAVNTWTLGLSAGSNLAIQAGGAGAVFLKQVSTAANGAVATTVTSLGPTGSHTTIQEWMVVTNASGTTRWIPCY